MGVDTNRIHCVIGAASKLSPFDIIRIVKSITAKQLFNIHPDLRRERWDGELWTDDFYVATLDEGGGPDAIRAYVAKQGMPLLNLKLFD